MRSDFYLHVDDEELQQEISRALSNLSPIRVRQWMRTEAQEHLSKRAAARFAGEGDDASGSWEELSQATIDRKGHDAILQETGKLKAYMVQALAIPHEDPEGVFMEYPSELPTNERTRNAYLATQFGTRNQVKRVVAATNEFDHNILINSLYEFTIGRWISGA